jgi:hypothetical protein
MKNIVIGKKDALRLLFKQQTKMLRQLQHIIETGEFNTMLNQTTQQKLDQLGALETKIGQGIDGLITKGTEALAAKDAVIAGLEKQIEDDKTEDEVAQAEIDQLKANANAATAEFNTGVDTVTAQAQSVADHLSAIASPSPIPPSGNPA